MSQEFSQPNAPIDTSDSLRKELYREESGESYTRLDVEVQPHKITICEVWGGPEIEKDFGDFDVEWFVIVEGDQRRRLVDALHASKTGVSPSTQGTEGEKILSFFFNKFGNRPKGLTAIKTWLETEGILYRFDRL